VRRSLPRIPRAILFDIYGTLFLSASGDVGTALASSSVESFALAFELLLGHEPGSSAAALVRDIYFRTIRAVHDEARLAHVDEPEFTPEVDIREVWQQVLAEAGTTPATHAASLQIAVLYESVANPVWPMPGAHRVLYELATRFRLGLVSNAQFYTELLPIGFWGASWSALGFDIDLTAFSYVEGRAKPDPRLFDRPLASLQAAGIDSTQVLYIGNDMRNDINTAARSGCMTALFAGDSGSLRLRSESSDDLSLPDTVLVRLSDVLATIPSGGSIL
jgi:putative hydrolase of the HAD superfamily